jgi:hypothetical protein
VLRAVKLRRAKELRPSKDSHGPAVRVQCVTTQSLSSLDVSSGAVKPARRCKAEARMGVSKESVHNKVRHVQVIHQER